MPEKKPAKKPARPPAKNLTRKAGDQIAVGELLPIRSQFRQLILANPNHFGTLAEIDLPIDLPVVFPLSGNTGFEELGCVGLNPHLDQLEATVRIKSNGGYNGTLCAGGSTEYVRFYISYDDGATWDDVGMEQFTVYDTTGPRPLDYAVNRVVPIHHTWCFLDNQPLVRAILSWNQPPTPATPGFTPVWGNVVDVRVQPTGSTLLVLDDLIDVLGVKLDPPLDKVLDLQQPLTLHDQAPLTVAQLATQYRRAKVEPHRFAFSHVQQLLAAPEPPSLPLANLVDLSAIELDLSQILDLIAATDGNTSYEELGCIGYDPTEDALVGVLTVKQPNGYSGGPCTGGSTEYVAFWVDWGSGFQYVGTSSVVVHDQSIPPGGLRYAVYQPIPTWAHRRDCIDGPVQPKVRAILSWQAPPPPGNPDWVPTWGNREQTTIQLAPGSVLGLRPVVDTIGGVAVCSIDQTDGRTIGADQPFGATLTVTGFIPGAPDRASPPMKYRIRVRDITGGGSWKTLTNDFGVTITEQVGAGLPFQYGDTQTVDIDDFYTYLEDPNPSGTGWRRVAANVLAQWITADPMTGVWEVEVTSKDPLGGLHSAQTIVCSDGTTRTNVRVRLDEKAPTTGFQITEFERAGTVFPAEECMKFKVGDILRGTYSVSDEHFRTLSFELDPAGPAAGAAPTASGPITFPMAPTSGTSGTWELQTGLMAPCGYVLRLRGWDRTIVSGNGIGWEAIPKAIGFSLEI